MAKFVTFKPVESEKLDKSEPVLKYKLLTSKAYPPTRETAGSIGYDLRSPNICKNTPQRRYLLFTPGNSFPDTRRTLW